MDCVHGFFASSGRCLPCQDSREAMSWWVVAAVGIAAATALAAIIWYRMAAGTRVGFAGGVKT